MITEQKNFLSDESGAVTVDWVVLTAALVGLGLAVMGVLTGGLQDVSTDIETQLRSDDMIRTSFSSLGASAILTDAEVSGLQATARGLQNEALGADYAAYAGAVDADYGAWGAGIADGTYVDDGFGSYNEVDGDGNVVQAGVFSQGQYDASATASDSAAIYADEANQRGLSWNPTGGDGSGAFE